MLNKVIKFPILAEHSADQIVVYQAFNEAIGKPAAAAGTLDVPAFSKTRMTWIKPSFLWMMYRSGWGHKDTGQQVILRLTMTRDGFAHLLRNACLSSYDPAIYPDRTEWQADLAALGFRDGENAVLFRSHHELVEKVRWWMQRPEALRALGSTAARHVRDGHSWAHRAAALPALIAV